MNASSLDIPSLIKDKQDIIGVEIGVERGLGSDWLLSNLSFKKLYGIDPYLPYSDPDVHHSNDENQAESNKQAALQLLAKYSNFELIQKTSDDAVTQFEDSSIDFIFIDGQHTYEQCKKDILNYYPKVKTGGLFAGHDFNYAPGVSRAVSELAFTLFKDIQTCRNDVWYWFK